MSHNIMGGVIIFENEQGQEVSLNVEIANNFTKRRAGLMERYDLPENSGMLFIWYEEDIRCMWMKNTFLPLDLVFLDKNSTILSKHSLVPESEESICSNSPARFAIETNAGWFKKQGIKVGSKITFSN
ncbi:MAG: DUF192 domain-containing protein [Gammaproteobacteria bacterium]